MKKVFYYTIFATSFMLFSGCSYSKMDKSIKYSNIPSNYNYIDTNISVEQNWLHKLSEPELINVVNEALNNNFELKRLDYDIKIKEQELIEQKSPLFPSVDAGVTLSKDGDFEGVENPSSSKVSLNIAYEIDLWGKLSDAKKAANMNLLETKATYKEAKVQLISDVAILYYNIVESNRLLALYEKNMQSSKDYYEILLSRYKSGLGDALDVLLSKNSIYTQSSKIANLKTAKTEYIYELEQLLGNYPEGKLDFDRELPLIKGDVKVGVPSEIIEAKPSIAAAWSALLSKDYAVAIAHKNRLPSLALSASILDSSADASPLGWSLLASLTSPIFNAGELKSKEEIAYFELKKAELNYLDVVFNAFVDIEGYIAESRNLKDEYEAYKTLYKNAKESFSMSFEQYLKGLVDYTTVLSSQDSLYEAEASLVSIKKSLIENRIKLHKALGGDFLPKAQKKEPQKQ